MAIPTYEDCMLPFLRVLADGEAHQTKDIVVSLSDVFGLTPDERAASLNSGQRVMINRVGWARTYLKKAIDDQNRSAFALDGVDHDRRFADDSQGKRHGVLEFVAADVDQPELGPTAADNEQE
jgi:restriction system protein